MGAMPKHPHLPTPPTSSKIGEPDRCQPNCVSTGSESSPGLSAKAAFSNAGTSCPRVILLSAPPIIADAVRAYREESDTLGRFIGECCTVRPLGQVRSSTLFKRYQEFAEQAGERWVPSKDLPHEMQRRGFVWKRTKAGGIYEGLELYDPTQE